jgi:hypothetical protein
VIKPVTPPPSPPSPTSPPKDRPPIHRGVRKRKPPKIEKPITREEHSLVSNLSKLANLSPKLRNRIMGEDV